MIKKRKQTNRLDYVEYSTVIDNNMPNVAAALLYTVEGLIFDDCLVELDKLLTDCLMGMLADACRSN